MFHSAGYIGTTYVHTRTHMCRDDAPERRFKLSKYQQFYIVCAYVFWIALENCLKWFVWNFNFLRDVYPSKLYLAASASTDYYKIHFPILMHFVELVLFFPCFLFFRIHPHISLSLSIFVCLFRASSDYSPIPNKSWANNNNENLMMQWLMVNGSIYQLILFDVFVGYLFSRCVEYGTWYSVDCVEQANEKLKDVIRGELGGDGTSASKICLLTNLMNT